jgi:tRNA nucleotidyltransferase/poly(A) polymerase family protein
MQIQIPYYIQVLIDLLNQNHYSAYVVGGAIRNALLGLPIHDYDLTTDATPNEMLQVFSTHRVFKTGIQHGTITVLSNGQPVEITTFRSENVYEDHRHPSGVSFSKCIEEDCKRRDFTINALCYNNHEGLIDFFGGIDDLQHKIIRCIGNASERIDEDALRILRALRFAGRLAFTIEEKTANAIHKQKDLLHYISEERIHTEWIGILETNSLTSILVEYSDVIQVFIPELTKDIIQHSLTAIYQSPLDANIRMAILLKNIPNAKEILERLKYSGAEQSIILSCTQNSEFKLSSKIELKQFLSTLKIPFDTYHQYRSAIDTDYSKETIHAYYQEIHNMHEPYQLKDLAIDGNVVKALGYQGKEIASILQKCMNIVIENPENNTVEYLTNMIKRTL